MTRVSCVSGQLEDVLKLQSEAESAASFGKAFAVDERGQEFLT
jgi:hypothetical protein